MHIDIKINSFSHYEKDLVALKWQSLELHARSNVFLSWSWINHWLDLVTDKVFLVEAYCDGNVVGLGFFVEKTRKVLGCFSTKQWWLHRTGIQEQDQIWIEYNDFLLEQSHARETRKKMIKAVSQFDPTVKEIIVGLATAETLEAFTDSFEKTELLSMNTVETNGYLTSLSCLRESSINKTLSKNSRLQISRSKKLLESQGELKFSVFSSPEKIVELYPKIARIHIDKWQVTNEGSGFSNPIFEKFHQSMAIDPINSVVQIAVLTLNEVDLGYLVNFIYQNKVYFYLSALTKSSDNKIKIGMTLHAEAIQYYAEQGLESYDFLGGEARYKKSLSNMSYSLKMKCYYRNGFLLRLEGALKKLKIKFKQALPIKS